MKFLTSHIALAWATVLFIVPLPFLATLAAGYPALYADTLFGAQLGVVAYTWMLAAVYLACRPRWVDRTVGLPHMYMIHGVLAILAIILAFVHQSLLPGAGELISLTGHTGLYLFIAVAVWSLVFMAGWLTSRVAWLATVKRALERLFRHEMSVWLHRLNLVAIALIVIHVHVIDYIASNRPFLFLLDAATIAVFAYYVWSSVSRRAFTLRGRVASVRQIAPRVTELRVSIEDSGRDASRTRASIRWNPGDFAFIAFPGVRGMHELHPFSLTNSHTGNGQETPRQAPVMSFAIRADGDFTAKIASLKPGERVRVVPPYGRYAEFIREHDAQSSQSLTPLVLIAGGIGVTPLIGVLTAYAGATGTAPASATRIVDFLYTARSERDFIYRDELQRFGASSPNTRVRLLTGRADEALIAPMIRPGAIYLIAGPMPMMDAVREILAKHGVASTDIYYEPFAM
ncbi:iron reductase [Bifidobacterium jacchi]|uniref:Iron reductase n=1 Tax=Bifidobacterium jacchi TaxID=2490545 RepID=A0A5N5RL40_9BIFI|nr:iron reductase [Bifidobacterium jacchi]KAB5607853.1 iron reductase [Bifidobacterium jacchi]